MSEKAPARASGEARGAGRGGPARGWSRPPFEPGNTVSTRHGSYATLQLRPRAEELAATLRDAMSDNYEARYEGAVAGAAMVGARLERAMAALEAAGDPKELSRLDADAHRWTRTWFVALAALGLTPASAARLGLDVAKSRHETRLADYLRDRYGEEVDGDA